MAFWTNFFSTKTMTEEKPKYQPLISEEFMEAIQKGNRGEVLRLIPLLGDREFLRKGLTLSKKTRWHAVTKDLQDAIVGKKNTIVSKSISYGDIRPHKSEPNAPFKSKKNVQKDILRGLMRRTIARMIGVNESDVDSAKVDGVLNLLGEETKQGLLKTIADLGEEQAIRDVLSVFNRDSK